MASRILIKLILLLTVGFVLLPTLAWAQQYGPGAIPGPASPTDGSFMSYMMKQTKQALQTFNNVEISGDKANQKSFFDHGGMLYSNENQQGGMTSLPIDAGGNGDGNSN